MNQWRLSWPQAWGEPLGQGRIRAVPADFFVQECLDEPLSGDGEHLYLFIEKEGDNTRFVAEELARMAGVRAMDVSYSGLKDRNAVTRQWFSLYLPGKSDETLLTEVSRRWRLLQSSRHSRKLRRGSHRANQFKLRVREMTAERGALDDRLQILAAHGCPNYFGEQRFGRDGANLDAAAALNPRRLRGRNFRHGLYLSAARSWLFNEYLAGRVENGTWRDRCPGDPAVDTPSGPLFGDGGSDADEPQRVEENRILEAYPQFQQLFDGARLRPERRPLILKPENLAWHFEVQDLILSFELPKGTFATALLNELVNTVSG